jgi:hypothetical protein
LLEQSKADVPGFGDALVSLESTDRTTGHRTHDPVHRTGVITKVVQVPLHKHDERAGQRGSR